LEFIVYTLYILYALLFVGYQKGRGIKVEHVLPLFAKIIRGQDITVSLCIGVKWKGREPVLLLPYISRIDNIFTLHHDAGLAVPSGPSWNTDQGVRRTRKRRGE